MTAEMIAMTMTTIVAARTSFAVGQVTFFSSCATSFARL